MKQFYHTLVMLLMGYCCAAQTPPANPSPCTIKGPPTLSIKGSSSFSFSNLAAFSTSQQSQNITVTVVSTNGSVSYELYVAGVITSLPASSTNTVIPINTFSIAASKPGSAPASVTLGNSYQMIAKNTKTSMSGDAQLITITLNPTLPGGAGAGTMNQFMQAPGTHVLTLYFCVCNN